MESILCCGRIIGWNRWYPSESPLSQLHMGGSCRFLSQFVIAAGRRPPSMILTYLVHLDPYQTVLTQQPQYSWFFSAKSLRTVEKPPISQWWIQRKKFLDRSLLQIQNQNLMGSILGRDLHGNVLCGFCLILLTNQPTNKLNDPGIFSHCFLTLWDWSFVNFSGNSTDPEEQYQACICGCNRHTKRDGSIEWQFCNLRI